MSLVVGAAPSRALNVVRVGGPFHEVVEARVPDPAKVGRDRGEPDAEVVDEVAGVVHPAPVGVGVGLAPVPNVERDGFAFRHGGRRLHVKFLPPLGEGDSGAVPRHAVDVEPLEVPPHRRAAPLQHGEGDRGVCVEGLPGVVGDVEEQFVMGDVEAVAPRDARPHVVVVKRQKAARSGLIVRAPHGVTPLNQKRGPGGPRMVVEARQGGVLGQETSAGDQKGAEKDGGSRVFGLYGGEHATKLGVLSPHETRRTRLPRRSGLHLAGQRPGRG